VKVPTLATAAKTNAFGPDSASLLPAKPSSVVTGRRLSRNCLRVEGRYRLNAVDPAAGGHLVKELSDSATAGMHADVRFGQLPAPIALGEVIPSRQSTAYDLTGSVADLVQHAQVKQIDSFSSGIPSASSAVSVQVFIQCSPRRWCYEPPCPAIRHQRD